MTIELHINGVLNRVWQVEEIREEPTEAGGKKWDRRVRRQINILKSEVYELLEFNEWEFFVVYPVKVNDCSIINDAWESLKDKIMAERVDKVVKKYGKVS